MNRQLFYFQSIYRSYNAQAEKEIESHGLWLESLHVFQGSSRHLVAICVREMTNDHDFTIGTSRGGGIAAANELSHQS